MKFEALTILDASLDVYVVVVVYFCKVYPVYASFKLCKFILKVTGVTNTIPSFRLSAEFYDVLFTFIITKVLFRKLLDNYLETLTDQF